MNTFFFCAHSSVIYYKQLFVLFNFIVVIIGNQVEQ